MLRSPFLIVLLCICSQAADQDNYEALESCSHENCLYTYSANQLSSVSGTQSEVHISSTVEVFCDSTGTYKELAATKYCFKLKDTSVSILDKDTRKSLNEASSDANQLLSGPFCFVQGEHGKIVSVYYNPSEKTQIINYKKGIAAAFQANFKMTEVEVEEDTQSKHYARYSFENIAPDHVIMHRVVDSESVIQFAASDLHDKPLAVQKAEHVEYKSGRMLSSAGTTTIKIEGPFERSDQRNMDDVTFESDSGTSDDTLGNGGLIGTGKYLLKLQSCMKKSKAFMASTKLRELTEGTLAAQFDEDEYDRDEMYRLRQSLPSIRKALIGLQKNLNDAATSHAINKLLALESKHGPIPGYQPALVDVMDYLNMLSPTAEDDFEMRSLLFSFIAAEGSANSQETIVRSMKTSVGERENIFLKQQLAFVRNVQPDILLQIEDIIASSGDITEPLILSYGALASAAAPKLQERIVQFLLDRLDAQSEDHTALIHLVHALGNTAASFSNGALLGLISHDNPSVRAAAVYALRHRLESKDVQNALKLALRANRQDPDFAEVVTRTLIAGAESAQFSRTEHAVDDSLIEELLYQSQTNGNNEVHREAMVHFYAKILGRKSPVELKDKERAMNEIKSSSQSESWDSESDQLFNLVSDISTRRADVNAFPRRKSLLWTKPLGVPQLKLDIAFGAFAGFPNSPNTNRNFKLFSKGYARAYAYGYSKTAFEATILSEHRPGSPSMTGKVYVVFIGQVLVDKKVETCKEVTQTLFSKGPANLLSATARVFIYVGTLEFYISLSAKFSVSASIKACVAQCVSAKGNVVPTITVTATVGAALNLIEIVRAGIDIKASFDYNAFPEVTASYYISDASTEFCFKILHGWPKNEVSIYAYYQHRTITWCKGFWNIPYPCGFNWSGKNKWNAASYTWDLPSYGPYTLWSSCNQLRCPAITMIGKEL